VLVIGDVCVAKSSPDHSYRCIIGAVYRRRSVDAVVVAVAGGYFGVACGF